MRGDEVQVKFGVDTGDLKSGLEQAKADFSSWTAGVSSDCNALLNTLNSQTEQMVAALKKPGAAAKDSAATSKDAFQSFASDFTSSVSSMLGPFMAIAGAAAAAAAPVAALGALFISSAKDQDEWVRDSLLLARGLGLTAEEASALKIKLDELSASTLTGQLSSEMLLRAVNMMVQKIAAGSPEIQKWNVAWKGTPWDTFVELARKYQELTSQTDKLQMSSDFFSRRLSVGLIPYLQFLGPITDQNRQKTEELGRTVDVHAVGASQRWAVASNRLDQQLKALHTTLGDPSGWAAWDDLVAGALKGLNAFLKGVINADTRIKGLTGALRAEIIPLGTAAAIGGAGGGPGPIMPKKSESGKEPEKLDAGGGGGGKGRMEAWRQELEDIQEEGNLLEKSLAQERAFWEQKLALCQQGSAEYLQVKHQLYEIDVASAKQSVNLQIAGIKQQMASEKESAAARLADQDRIVALNLQNYGKDSMNYQNALLEKKKLEEEVDKANRELAQQKLANSLKLAQMDVEAAKERIKSEKSLGLISASEELAQMRNLKAQELALEKQNFEDRKNIWAQYPKKMAEILQEVQVAEKKNALEIQKTEAQAAQDVQNKWKAAMAPIDSAMTTAINGMIQGTQNFQKMLAHILSGILTSYLNLIAKSLQNWIAGEAAKLLSTQTTAAQVAAAQIAAIPVADASLAMADIQAITGSAAQGAAAAYAAMAGIPVVGPELGAEAAAQTYAAIMAYAAMVPAAAGGWDVPRDSLAYVHKQEMILPATLAAGVRGLVAGGQAAPRGGDVHFHVSAMDGNSVRQFFKNNRGHIADSVKSAIRDGRRLK